MRNFVMEPSSPLHIAAYRKFWIARLLAVFATTGMVIVIGYQLYEIARSTYGMSIREAAFLLGFLGLVQFVPLFVLTPVAGVVADRIDRRLLAGISIAIDCGIALGFAFVTITRLENLPVLFGLAALHGVARVFLNPSMTAIAPNIVPPIMLPRAIAFNSIATQSGSVAGPAVAGYLYAASGPAPYLVSAVLLAIASILVFWIGRLPVDPDATRTRPVRQMVKGFQFVWNDRFLLGCITLDLFAVLLGGATALLPVFARDILHVGPEGLGQMRAAPAVGAALVALVLSFRPLQYNVGVKMLWAVVVFGLATISFAVSRELWLSLASLVVLGMADMISMFVRSSLVQLNTPDDVRGRVSAISGLAISASNELGEMQSGIAAALLGAVGATVFGGVSAIIITLLWAWIFPEIRHARTFATKIRERNAGP